MVKRLIALSIILSLALFLRAAGVEWSLPNASHPMLTYHPDEGSMLAIVSHMNPAKGDINPNWFHYPHLHFYTLGAAFYAGNLAHVVKLVPSEDYYLKHPDQTAQLYRIGRMVSVLYGLATIALLFYWGYGMGFPAVGWISAFLLAVLPLHVVNSSFMTVDVPMTFWVTLCLGLICVYLKRSQHTPSLYFLMFVVAGIATAVKYPAFLLLVPIWIAVWRKGEMAHIFSILTSRRLWLGYLSMALTFFVLSPYVILDFKHSYPSIFGLYKSVVIEKQESSTLPLHQLYHLLYSMPVGWGIPLMFASVFAVAWALYRRRSTDSVVAIWVLFYFVFFSIPEEKYLRYLLPIAPATCYLVAQMLVDIYQLAQERKVKFAVAVMALGILGMTLVKGLAYSHLLSETDARDLAYAWMQQNIAQGAGLTLMELPYAYSPPGLYEFEDKGWGLYRKSPRYKLAILDAVRPNTTIELRGQYFVLSDYDLMRPLLFPDVYPIKNYFISQLLGNHEQLRVVFDEKVKAKLGPFSFDRGYVPEDWLYINPRQLIIQRISHAS